MRATRPGDPKAAELSGRWLSYGASVRAAQFIVLGAKARAVSNGNLHVSIDDVQAMTRPVLRHRLLRNFFAESEGVSVDNIIDELLTVVPKA